MCGEHAEEYLESLEQRGSSPHVRGALNRACAVCAVVGIIPACAGSTVLVESDESGVVGSSPHVRGAHYKATKGSRALGIIPACAGSTSFVAKP